MDYQRIVLITRKTRLEGLIERFNTPGQAKFYLEHSGGDFEQYQREHDVYVRSLAQLRDGLHKLSRVHEIERSFLANYVFGDTDIVVAIGIDGLVANIAKYLDGQPLIAANPDPAHIDGVLLPFTAGGAVAAARRVLEGASKARLISMAEAQLNDGQTLLAFNDFFIGARSHISARYVISAQGREEHHSSSGVIVSTGVGSTGWLSSLFNMANGMLAGFAPAGRHKAQTLPPIRLDWEADRLVFVVREPFLSKTSRAEIVCGLIAPGEPLVLQSEMPEGGVIFSDGVESDFLAFNSGSTATINLASRKTHLVVG